MKRSIVLFMAATLSAGSLAAAPKDDAEAGIKKLAEASSYAWTSTSTNLAGGGRGGRGFRGATEGKAVKDGYAMVSRPGFQGSTFVTYTKGDKMVMQNRDGEWQTSEEMAAAFGGGGGGRGRGGFFRSFNQLPTVQAEELLGKARELKEADGAITGDLDAEGAASLMPFRRGRGGDQAPPPPANAKGSVKFWLKDGMLAKYEYNVQGTMSFGGNDFDMNRTTTIEIKDVGSTKVEVPEEARKKLE